ncbi:hypothetical protein [Nocardia asiatica]|nr:hypothetical protein [Nocardia asiatica]
MKIWVVLAQNYGDVEPDRAFRSEDDAWNHARHGIPGQYGMVFETELVDE